MLQQQIEELLRGCFPNENRLLVSQLAVNVTELLQATSYTESLLQDERSIRSEAVVAESDVLYFL